MKRQDVVFSGMRPTGRLHLGNYWGALKNWVGLMTQYPCYFSVVDWHMLTTGYDDTSKLKDNVREMVLDWLAAGLDPAKCVIFRQSDVPEHAELALMLGMVTPLSWLENNPTWKEQLQELSKTKESLARLELDRRVVHRKAFEQIMQGLVIHQIDHPENEDIENFYFHLNQTSSELIHINDIAAWSRNPPHSNTSTIEQLPNAVVQKAAMFDIAAEEIVEHFVKVLVAFQKERIFHRNLPADFLTHFHASTHDKDIHLKDFLNWIERALGANAIGSQRLRTLDGVVSQILRLFVRNESIRGTVPAVMFKQFLQAATEESGADESLRTFGFLGYPVLQAADILLYRGSLVPVGQDQLPHVELSRDIAHKFNRLFGEIFVEPRPLLTPSPRVPGTDGRKMSKSYNNAIDIYETAKSLEMKVKGMYTDPNRKTATDPGHPLPCTENPPGCSVYALHKLYADEAFYAKRGDECRAGQLGCSACKKDLLSEMTQSFDDFRRRRDSYASNPQKVDGILAEGGEKARTVARSTMDEVRRAMRLR